MDERIGQVVPDFFILSQSFEFPSMPVEIVNEKSEIRNQKPRPTGLSGRA